jgi:hypothetical protein
MRRPGRRAGDEADHRLGDLLADDAAASSSAVPPISPIITIASVPGPPGTAQHVDEALPFTGSPPMPTRCSAQPQR